MKIAPFNLLALARANEANAHYFTGICVRTYGIVSYAIEHSQKGVSNHWNGIWNEMVEWKMEWNGECT